MRPKHNFALISWLLSNAAAQTAATFTAALLLVPGIVLAGVNAWASLGPDGGGALILVVDPQSPDTVYASTGTGLFKSTDGAGSWSAMSPLPAGTGTIVSLVVDPQNSGTLYAAGDLGDSGGDAVFKSSDAVFKSTDGGATWRALQSGSVFRLSAPLAIDPRNSNVLYSGTYNAVLKSNAILKSDDGGATWKVSTAGYMYSGANKHVVKQYFRTRGLTLFFRSQFLSSTHRLCEHGPPNVFPFETSCSFGRAAYVPPPASE